MVPFRNTITTIKKWKWFPSSRLHRLMYSLNGSMDSSNLPRFFNVSSDIIDLSHMVYGGFHLFSNQFFFLS